MERNCVACGEKLLGRIDKKFCSDSCRNSYNNSLNRDHKKIVRNVNNILRRNYRILELLNPDGKTRINQDHLISKGFSFEYFTSIYTTKTGNTYYFVYDQGYLSLEGNSYALVKRNWD